MTLVLNAYLGYGQGNKIFVTLHHHHPLPGTNTLQGVCPICDLSSLNWMASVLLY